MEVEIVDSIVDQRSAVVGRVGPRNGSPLRHLTTAERSSTIAAAIAAAADQGFIGGEITVLITDDAAIHDINRRHLDHDYPTDVISFGYASDPDAGTLEGELVVSREMAAREAAARGIDPFAEMILYVVHGTLHIAGLDDTDTGSAAQMRAAERRVLVKLGYAPEIADRIVGATPTC